MKFDQIYELDYFAEHPDYLKCFPVNRMEASMKWLKLTDANGTILVNMDQQEVIYPSSLGGSHIYSDGDPNHYHTVSETIEQIEEMMRERGWM